MPVYRLSVKVTDMNSFKPSKVLVLMAHPDDEALSCFGTLARFSAEGSEIVIAFFTDGHQGRLNTSLESSKLINARINIIDELQVENEIVENRKFVACVDKCIASESPSLVITHGYANNEHHEHNILSKIVQNSIFRSELHLDL